MTIISIGKLSISQENSEYLVYKDNSIIDLHEFHLIISLLFSTLGKDVIGIWPKNSENGDINNAHLSNSGQMLATGDDFGYVKLFKFPVDQKFVSGHLLILQF